MVKRYSLHRYHPDVMAEPEMYECDDGEYVKFTDHSTRLAEAERIVRKIVHEWDGEPDDIGDAQQWLRPIASAGAAHLVNIPTKSSAPCPHCGRSEGEIHRTDCRLCEPEGGATVSAEEGAK